MNVNKLPQNIDEIGSFYKNALHAQEEYPSMGSFASVFEKLPSSLQEERGKKKSFSLFHPKAFKIAASLSTIIITSVLVLAGSLAVVTVVYDYKVPKPILFFNRSESSEKTTKDVIHAVKPSPKIMDNNAAIKAVPQLEVKQEVIIAPTITEIEKQNTNPLIQTKKEEKSKELMLPKTSPADNKKLLEELKEEELFK